MKEVQKNLQVGQEVWVTKSKVKADDKKKRKGIIKYLNQRFIGVWVETGSNANLGWIECYLYQDLRNGDVTILPRGKKDELKIS